MNKVSIQKNIKSVCLVLIAALALSLTACKPKDPVTANDFRAHLEAQGQTVVDITDQYAGYAHVRTAFAAEFDSVHIEFFEINNRDNTNAMFKTNKEMVEAFKGNTSVNTSVSISNYQKYTLNTADNHYVVSQIETTLIYAYCAKADSDTLDTILKDLGY